MSLYHITLSSSIYLCSRVLGTPQLCYRWNILFPSCLADLELARVTSEILYSILDLFPLTPLPLLVLPLTASIDRVRLVEALS